MMSIRVVIAVLLLMGIGGCAADSGGESGGAGTRGVPLPAGPTAERLHQAVGAAVIEEPKAEGYLLQVARRLASAAREVAKDRKGPMANLRTPAELLAPEAIVFHLVASPVANAYTAGPPHVYVYAGLLQRCSGEDELAAVMAHELAHLMLGHPAVRGSLGMESQTAAALALRLADAGYDPGEEQRADEVGLAIFVRGGWDPGRYAAFFGGMGGTARGVSLRERLERLPPVAGDWARPPIADERWFNAFKGDVMVAANGVHAEAAERVLAALPSVYAGFSAEQMTARRELERELNPPALPAPGPAPGGSPTAAPSGFEKGPRGR